MVSTNFKALPNSLLMGASLSGWTAAQGVPSHCARPPALEALATEIKAGGNWVRHHHPEFGRAARAGAKPETPDWKVHSSALSLILHAAQDHIIAVIEEVAEECGLTVATLSLDGLFVTTPQGRTPAPGGLMPLFSKRTSASTTN